MFAVHIVKLCTAGNRVLMLVLSPAADIMEGQHKVGGIYHEEFATYSDCITGCRSDNNCVAVDFSPALVPSPGTPGSFICTSLKLSTQYLVSTLRCC